MNLNIKFKKDKSRKFHLHNTQNVNKKLVRDPTLGRRRNPYRVLDLSKKRRTLGNFVS